MNLLPIPLRGFVRFIEPLFSANAGAGVPVTSPQLYSALHTEDIRVAIMFIADMYPRAPLIGVGFSLGANVLTRYMAEEGPRCRLAAGCAIGCVSPPFWHSPAILHTPPRVLTRALYDRIAVGPSGVQ